ncbi:hypothetical protein [Cupriavidus sp. H18C1]|uniref:hypothetical protein n=1 Tax=Cupriavidus sp. H18C1 TaxID=3241601 RepID=UPI003BB867DC
MPAEDEQSGDDARPTQENISEAMAEHCESNGYSVAPEVIESLAKLVAHMGEPAVDAPAAAANDQDALQLRPLRREWS